MKEVTKLVDVYEPYAGKTGVARIHLTCLCGMTLVEGMKQGLTRLYLPPGASHKDGLKLECSECGNPFLWTERFLTAV